MVELKALNGCVVQASEDAVHRLLAAGFVHTGETAPLEQPKKTAPKKRATKKTTESK
jgi:hypothetical protein